MEISERMVPKRCRLNILNSSNPIVKTHSSDFVLLRFLAADLHEVVWTALMNNEIHRDGEHSSRGNLKKNSSEHAVRYNMCITYS